MRKVFIIATLLLAAAAHAQDARHVGYQRMVDGINARVAAGSTTPLQAAQEKLDGARMYYPEDSRLHAARQLQLSAAQQHADGSLTRTELDARQAEIWSHYLGAVKDEELREQVAMEQQRRAALIGGALVGAGRGLQQANPPTVTCNSIALGGQLTTTCR